MFHFYFCPLKTWPGKPRKRPLLAVVEIILYFKCFRNNSKVSGKVHFLLMKHFSNISKYFKNNLHAEV